MRGSCSLLNRRTLWCCCRSLLLGLLAEEVLLFLGVASADRSLEECVAFLRDDTALVAVELNLLEQLGLLELLQALSYDVRSCFTELVRLDSAVLSSAVGRPARMARCAARRET